MGYITSGDANMELQFLGQFLETWSPLDEEVKLEYIQRATDRLEMLQFKQDNPVVLRIGERYTASTVPDNIKTATSILAGWYADSPLLRYEIQGDTLEDAMSPHLADLPITVQNLVFPFITDKVQSNEPDPKSNKAKAAAFDWE